MLNAPEIRAQLAKVLREGGDLDAFRIWLARESWNGSNTDARELVGDIELSLAEHANGDWSDAALHEHLSSLAHQETVVSFRAKLTTDAITGAANAMFDGAFPINAGSSARTENML